MKKKGILFVVLLAGSSAFGISLINFNINLGTGPIFNPAPSGVLSPPAIMTYAETPLMASMDIVGGDFDTDSTISFGFIADYWAGSFTISQDSGYVNDALSINGTFKHIINPPGHNDTAFGDTFSWNFTVDADDATGSPLTVFNLKVENKDHLPHYDHFEAKLTATVVTDTGFDDISGWTFTLKANHIPEPLTICLFGLAGFMLRFKRQL